MQMRAKPLGGRSISGRVRVLAACSVALAALSQGGPLASPSSAAACPNSQFRSGPSEHLPDCRAYEQVSPEEKGGQDAVTLEPTLPAQASACEGGEACTIAYMSLDGAFAGAASNDVPNAYLGVRQASGWQTTALTPAAVGEPANDKVKVSYAFSNSLSQAVLRVPFAQLTKGAPAGVDNLFLRQADGTYSLLTTAPPSSPPQPGCGSCFEQEDVPAFAGASSDFSHVLFEANDSLVADAPAEGVENLYEATGGAVQLVGILPDGEIPPAGAAAGGGIDVLDEHTGELAHAMSEDGSQVVFEAAADGGMPDSEQNDMTEVYDRIDGSSTLELSAPAPGAQAPHCETEGAVCNAEPAQFLAASADGSSVYFTSKAALTKGSYTGVEPTSGPEPRENPGNDLYRYDVSTRTLQDLTADGDDSEDPDGADVLGVVGASEDGSYVYFVAEGHLGDAPTGQPSPQPNLYVWHEGPEGSTTVRFITALEAPDEAHKVEEEENLELMRPGSRYRSDIADWTSRPSESQAYVTPDGKHLALMSVRSLTGYENKDAVTGEADHEVFEYSAENGQLTCVSCDPSGARPLGSAFIGAKLAGPSRSPFHEPRVVSDDGSRVFFSSPDPLVHELAGGSTKIFEYEDGGIQLISGAEVGGKAVFLDASASGNDVFIATREQLAPTDTDELLDVYDARVDGGLPAPPAPSSCEGSTCQESLGSPPSLATPVSALFTGSGNLAPVPPGPAVKPTRKQLLARALAKCERMKRKQARSACVKAAKRRYGSTPKRRRRITAMAHRRSAR
jgi:hypothetical protein